MFSNAENFYNVGGDILDLEIDQFDWKIWDNTFHVPLCIWLKADRVFLQL